MAWILEGDSFRCDRHNVVFAKGEPPCGQCTDDPGPAPTAAVAVKVEHPKGCPSSEAVRRSMAADLAEMRALRDQLLGKEASIKRGRGKRKPKTTVIDTHLANSIVKVQDCITKLARALVERADKYEDAALTAAMLEEKRRTGAGH